jgi:hypothetical protein
MAADCEMVRPFSSRAAGGWFRDKAFPWLAGVCQPTAVRREFRFDSQMKRFSILAAAADNFRER